MKVNCHTGLKKLLYNYSVEHVFSLLSNNFNSQQISSMEDYIETSIMLQYNYRKLDQQFCNSEWV